MFGFAASVASKCLCNNVSLKGTPSVAMATLRYKSSGRGACARETGPRCSKIELAKTQCMKNLPKKKLAEKKKLAATPVYEQPLTEECCGDVCGNQFPRFDDLYYEESDKKNRKYQKTWKSCGVLKIMNVPKCCNPDYGFPDMEKRPPHCNIPICKKPACSKATTNLGLMKCGTIGMHKKCMRVVLPCCKGSRIPPKCVKARRKRDCRKRCTKYPSFSECKKPPANKKRPVECKCLDRPALCSVIQAAIKKELMER